MSHVDERAEEAKAIPVHADPQGNGPRLLPLLGRLCSPRVVGRCPEQSVVVLMHFRELGPDRASVFLPRVRGRRLDFVED